MRGQPNRWTPRAESWGPAQGPPASASASRRLLSWPKSSRLRKRPDFLRVQSQGRRRSGRHVTAVVMASSGAETAARFGLVVTRKLGGAVVRNRIKRRLREVLRRLTAWVPAGDIVLLARRSVADAPWEELVADVSRALAVNGVVR